jgi:hypothetical protein
VRVAKETAKTPRFFRKANFPVRSGRGRRRDVGGMRAPAAGKTRAKYFCKVVDIVKTRD